MESPRQAKPKGPVPSDFVRPYVKCKADDRRKHPRLQCKGIANIHLIESDTKVAGALLNLSVTGCSVECAELMIAAEHQAVEVTLSVDSAKLRLAGVVRYVRRNGRIGIEFTEVTERKVGQIKELVLALVLRRMGAS